MHLWKPALAGAVSIVAAAEAADPLSITTVYSSKTPTGQTHVRVEVGDVIFVTVDGQETSTGRVMTFKANSNYDEYETKGCRRKKKVKDMPRDGTFPTEASLFQHYYPTISIPGSGNTPLLIRERNLTYVVREAGTLTLSDLITDPETVYLDGPAPAPNAKEQDVLDRERNKRKNAGHYNISVVPTIQTGSVNLSVKVRIQRP